MSTLRTHQFSSEKSGTKCFSIMSKKSFKVSASFPSFACFVLAMTWSTRKETNRCHDLNAQLYSEYEIWCRQKSLSSIIILAVATIRRRTTKSSSAPQLSLFRICMRARTNTNAQTFIPRPWNHRLQLFGCASPYWTIVELLVQELRSNTSMPFPCQKRHRIHLWQQSGDGA